MRLVWGLTTRDYAEFMPEVVRTTPSAPDLVFDDSLTITLGARRVQIVRPGRGNTAGDAFLFLPDERVLLTGDLVTVPCPFPGTAYFADWIRSLDALEARRATTIVPGHGDVQHDYAYVAMVRELLAFTLERARDAVKQRDHGGGFPEADRLRALRGTVRGRRSGAARCVLELLRAGGGAAGVRGGKSVRQIPRAGEALPRPTLAPRIPITALGSAPPGPRRAWPPRAHRSAPPRGITGGSGQLAHPRIPQFARYFGGGFSDRSQLQQRGFHGRWNAPMVWNGPPQRGQGSRFVLSCEYTMVRIHPIAGIAAATLEPVISCSRTPSDAAPGRNVATAIQKRRCQRRFSRMPRTISSWSGRNRNSSAHDAVNER